ncbi:MAG TPA: T9SS type A sorting domain-containing protein, partial [Cytophagales bacterium]|jgi:hypothetical protein
VDAEGTRRLTNYDVFTAAGGALKAVTQTLRVTVTDGVLNLLFTKGAADNPMVSAIEVLPAPFAARVAPAGENGESGEGRAHLYPNPVRDQLTVKLPFPASALKATLVTDAAGTVHLRNAHAPSGPDAFQLRTAGLPAGFYLLRLETGQGATVLKFLKQ